MFCHWQVIVTELIWQLHKKKILKAVFSKYGPIMGGIQRLKHGCGGPHAFVTFRHEEHAIKVCGGEDVRIRRSHCMHIALF